MSEGQRTTLLNVGALVVGVLVAIASVTAHEWLVALAAERVAIAEGGSLIVSPASQARIAAAFSALTAIPIVSVCLPIWILLARSENSNWMVAAVLAFAGTLAAWVILYDFISHLPEALGNGLPYGFCGALAGVATWWASSGRRAVLASRN